MSKTPEEYFQEQSFSVPGTDGGKGGFSAAELTFIRKYMGIEAPDALRKLGLGEQAEELAKKPAPPSADATPFDSLMDTLDQVKPQSGAPAAAVAEMPEPVEQAVPRKLASVLDDAAPAATSGEIAEASVTSLEVEGAHESLDEPETVAPVLAEEPEVADDIAPVLPAEPEITADAGAMEETPLEGQPADSIADQTAEQAADHEAAEDVLASASPAAVTTLAVDDSVEAAEAAGISEEVAEMGDAQITGDDEPDSASLSLDSEPEEATPAASADAQELAAGDESVELAAPVEIEPGGLAIESVPLEPLGEPAENVSGEAVEETAMQDAESPTATESGLLDPAGTESVQDEPVEPEAAEQEAASSDAVAQPDEIPVETVTVAEDSAPPASAEATEIKDVAPVAEELADTPQHEPETSFTPVAEQAAPAEESAFAVSVQTPEQPAITAEPAAEKLPDAAEAAEQPVAAKPAAGPEIAKKVKSPDAQDKTAASGKRETASIAEIYDGMDIQEALEHYLRNEQELQMVAFYLGDQEFTVPTVIVQEVIHYSEPAKLPVAPPFVAGVINLRGKVTPLVYLRDILEVKQGRQADDRFIIICRFQGLQVGLIIERVHTMYRVPQMDIDWGIEAHLGINVDFVSGLLKLNEKLIGIVSVDRIVTSILQDF